MMSRLVIAFVAATVTVSSLANAQIPPRVQQPQVQQGGALVAPPIAPPGTPGGMQPFAPSQGGGPGVQPFTPGQGALPGEAPSLGNFQPGGPSGAFSGPIDPATVERASRQSRGDFGELQRSSGVPLGMTQDAWSRPFQNMAPGQIAPGVVRFQWTPDLIMPIRIREFMNTAIILPEWERVEDVYIGETYFMSAAIVRPNVVLLRTSQSGIDATVTILGASSNLYTFYVRSEGFNTRRITDIQVFVQAPLYAAGTHWFRGSNTLTAPTSGQASTAAQPANSSVASGAPNSSPTTFNSAQPRNERNPGGALGQSVPGPSPDGRVGHGGSPVAQGSGGDMLVPRDRMIFDMQMYEVNEGDRVIAPDYVYSDGVFTYFHFGTRAREMEMPVVYRVVDGVETRVNTRTAGRFGEILIAEARGDFTLRAGARAVCIRRQPPAAR